MSANPIVARHVNNDTYDFPFDVVVREMGDERAVGIVSIRDVAEWRLK